MTDRKKELMNLKVTHTEDDLDRVLKEIEYIDSRAYQNMSSEERHAFHVAQFALMGTCRADREYMKDKIRSSSYNDLQKGYMSDLID